MTAAGSFDTDMKADCRLSHGRQKTRSWVFVVCFFSGTELCPKAFYFMNLLFLQHLLLPFIFPIKQTRRHTKNIVCQITNPKMQKAHSQTNVHDFHACSHYVHTAATPAAVTGTGEALGCISKSRRIQVKAVNVSESGID